MSKLAPCAPLRVNRDRVSEAKEALGWVARLNGTDHPEGQDEMRAELKRLQGLVDELVKEAGA